MHGASAEERRDRRRDRVRRAAAIMVLAVAVVITAATSYVDAEVVEELAGDPFLLTPDAPIASVPVTFAATSDSFRGDPSVSLLMTHSAVWAGIEDATQELLEVALVPHDTSGAPRIGDARCRLDSCTTFCHGRGCVGSFDLVFRWPEHLGEGSARIDWSVEGRFTWPDDGGFFSATPEPAEGTELSFEFGEVTGGQDPPTPVAAWETVVTPDVGVVQESVTVTTSRSLEGGALALETAFAADVLRAALPNGWEADGRAMHLASASSVPIPVPEHCHDGPCTFTFDTLAQLVRPHMVADYRSAVPTADWAITTTTPVDVEVVSRRARLPGAASQARLGRIVLEGAEATDGMRFVVTLPAATLPSEEWPPELADLGGEGAPHRLAPDGPAGAGPVVMLELRPDVEPATVEVDARPDLRLQLVLGRDTNRPAGERLATWSERGIQPSQWEPWRTALHNRCLPDQTCEIEVEVRATTRYREPPDGDPVTAFALDAEVVVLLPWTQPPPSETPDIRLVNQDGVRPLP